MFAESIEDAHPGVPLFGSIEGTVLKHEAGHLLGLVANGVSMQTNHQDPAHEGHDASDQCLMYWAIETSSVADILLGREPDFDAACRADLVAAGGRAPTP
jgi:hypothetical protein